MTHMEARGFWKLGLINMTTFMLVMLISGNFSDSGLTTSTVEFNSLESCQAAAKSLLSQASETNYVKVRAWGCYKK